MKEIKAAVVNKVNTNYEIEMIQRNLEYLLGVG